MLNAPSEAQETIKAAAIVTISKFLIDIIISILSDISDENNESFLYIFIYKDEMSEDYDQWAKYPDEAKDPGIYRGLYKSL